MRRCFLAIILLLLAACSAEPNPAQPNPTETTPLSPIPSNSATASLQSTETVLPSPSPTATPTPVSLEPGILVSQLDVAGQPLVALTIDDGYGRIPFDAILGELRERNLQATYFLVAQAAQNLGPERMQQLVEDGHQLAYHSFSHDDLELLRGWGKQDWIADFEAWETAFIELLGPENFARGFRPYARAPYGLFSLAFLAMTEELDLAPVGWSKDPGDLARGLPMASGDIFLLHVRYPDADLMGPIFDQYPFEFVTLDELIAASE